MQKIYALEKEAGGKGQKKLSHEIPVCGVFAGFDMECRKHVEAEYQRQGIHMYPTFCPQEVQRDPDGHLTVKAKNSQGREMALTGMDCVLMATGRKPNSKGLGLEEASHCCQSAVGYKLVLFMSGTADGQIKGQPNGQISGQTSRHTSGHTLQHVR